ncbi:MAG: amidohydrolase/deacetylase family metallohydrolase [Nitrososphaerota archaeon]
MYDIIIKNGLLIDPFQEIHEKKDIAISNDRIVAVESHISSEQAKKIIDASEMIVTPGLIDIHTHCSYNVVRLSIDPDSACLKKGSTTIVDAGSIGELLFTPFKKYVIEKSKARIYALLNIESLGMIEYCNKQPTFNDQDWTKLLIHLNEFFAPLFINIDNTLKIIKENKNIIIGIKWAHRGLKTLEFARKVADKANCLLMIENRCIPDALNFLRKGDVLTHLYAPIRKEKSIGLLDDNGKVLPEFFKAVKKGVVMDVGHGKKSFSWNVAEKAIDQGIMPDTISTDLWTANINGPVYDMPTTMSKFLLLGMSLDEAVKASTTKPAEILGKIGEIGTLKPGACADVTIFKLKKGNFSFIDCKGKIRKGNKKLITVKVIRNGIEIV